PPASDTLTSTFAPLCCSITLPKLVWVPQSTPMPLRAETWQLVKSKVIACAGVAVAIEATPSMATANTLHLPRPAYARRLLSSTFLNITFLRSRELAPTRSVRGNLESSNKHLSCHDSERKGT